MRKPASKYARGYTAHIQLRTNKTLSIYNRLKDILIITHLLPNSLKSAPLGAGLTITQPWGLWSVAHHPKERIKREADVTIKYIAGLFVEKKNPASFIKCTFRGSASDWLLCLSKVQISSNVFLDKLYFLQLHLWNAKDWLFLGAFFSLCLTHPFILWN